MSLAERSKNPPRAVCGMPCSIAAALAKLDKAEAKALQAMLDSPDWSQTAIWDALRDEGIDVGRQSVNRHRSGKCRCAREPR